MTEIEVSRVEVEPLASRLHVVLKDEDGSSTEHEVTLSRADQERLGEGYPSPEAFIRACFAFLLARESKESILGSFDVSQISTFFPAFERQIRHSAEG